MAIIGKTFDAQLVSAGDDGALYRMLACRKDALTPWAGGNPFTISNNVLSIAQSYLLLCGRFMRIGGGTTISLGTIPSNHVRGRVIVTLDMTKLATESTLSQIITEVETIASGGSFRSLTTNDINSIGASGKYEAVLCTFTCSSGTASSPVSALSTTLSYPQITKITFNGDASAGALQNLKIQSAEVLSGKAFVDTTTSAWNYYVPVGTYRIILQGQFPTGSATDYYGMMVGRDAIPNYSLACQFGCGLSEVQRLNASGIMVNTNSSEAHSFIVRSNKALTDVSGFITIEKLS